MRNSDKAKREDEGKAVLGRVLDGLRDTSRGARANERVRQAQRIVEDEKRRGIGPRERD